MRKPGIIIVMAFALACTATSLAQAAVSKPANSVPLYQQMQKKRLTQNEPAQTPICENSFQCLFGGSRRSGGSSVNRSPLGGGGGFSDQVTRTTVSFDDAKYKPGTIIIRTPERALYYVLPGGKALRYKVGVGREGFQWGGRSRIIMKREWPEWRPPAIMIDRERRKGHIIPAYMEGGPNNPLGARSMYIGGTLFRIHGTNDARTIGCAVSSGCIRLMNADVIDLYDRVGIGSPVFVYQ